MRDWTHVTVNDPHDFGWRHVLREQLSMTGVCSSIPADEDCQRVSPGASMSTEYQRTIPTLVRGNEPKILRLGLCALSHTARNAALELVRA
jgi:hypothetical protein